MRYLKSESAYADNKRISISINKRRKSAKSVCIMRHHVHICKSFIILIVIIDISFGNTFLLKIIRKMIGCCKVYNRFKHTRIYLLTHSRYRNIIKTASPQIVKITLAGFKLKIIIEPHKFN